MEKYQMAQTSAVPRLDNPNCTGARMPEVTASIERLARTAELLRSNTLILIDKIRPILREEMKNEECCEKGTPVSQTPIADNINTIESSLSELSDMVNATIARIEV